MVFVLADDLGYGDVGYQTNESVSAVKTPFIDSLAGKCRKTEPKLFSCDDNANAHSLLNFSKIISSSSSSCRTYQSVANVSLLSGYVFSDAIS